MRPSWLALGVLALACAVLASFHDDLYRLFDLSPGATPTQLRRAYHRKSLQYHPDKNPASKKKWAQDKFTELSNACAIPSRLCSRADAHARRGPKV